MDEKLIKLQEAMDESFRVYIATAVDGEMSEHSEEQDAFFAATEAYMLAYAENEVTCDERCKDVAGVDNSELRASICELLGNELPVWFYKRFVTIKEEWERTAKYGSKADKEKMFSRDFMPRLKNQTGYYIRKYLENEGKVSGVKEWKELEEAYLVCIGEKNFEETETKKKLDETLKKQFLELEKLRKKNAKPSSLEEMEDIIENLEGKLAYQTPEVVMYSALEAFAGKAINSIQKIAGEFKEDVIAMVVADAMGYDAEHENTEKLPLWNRRTFENEKEFCRYFRGICLNKYKTAVAKEITRQERFESYDVLVDNNVAIEEAGSENHEFVQETAELTAEMSALLQLVLLQVAKGPITAYNKPEPYKNIGGAFAKYIPFLDNEYVERNGKYELHEGVYKDGENVLQARVRKGADQAATTMYEVVKNHTALSAADLFVETLAANEINFTWNEMFYNVIEEAGETKYIEKVKKADTMRENAKKLHELAMEQCMDFLEAKMGNEEESKSLLDMLNKMLDGSVEK